MAAPAASSWTSYGVGWPKSIDANATASAVGNKEQFLGEIAILDPTDTPTFAMLQKEAWSAPYKEWPIDSLAATSTAGSYEAWEWEATTLSGRTRYNNVTQAFHRGLLVSRRQQQMSQRGVTQGVGDEYRYQVGKKLLELNRDINSRLLASGTAISSATGATGTVARTANFLAFPIVVTNVSGAFATASFAALHRKMDELGATPDTMLVSSGVKADISNSIMGLGAAGTAYATAALRRINAYATDKELSAIVEVIEDDFGRIQIFRDRWIPTASTTNATATNVTGIDLSAGSATAFVKVASAGAYYLFDKKMVKVGVFQPPVHKALPPNGDYERGFVMAEIATQIMHPSSVGVGANVTQTAI